MSLALLISGRDRAALTDAWRIPRAQVTAFADGLSLLKEGDRRLTRAIAEIEADRAAARQAGYDAGHAEGLRAAAAETAAQMALLINEAARQRAEVRESVGVLALEVVRRIAGEAGAALLAPAMVERAVREILPDQPMRVRVAAAVAGVVEGRLWAINAAIEVVPDPELSEFDCVLETGNGRVQAGLEAQLSALERVFAGAAA